MTRDFKPGEEVIAFEWKRTSPWKPVETIEYAGEVVAVKDGSVWVDTIFGPLAFKPEDVEYADAPF